MFYRCGYNECRVRKACGLHPLSKRDVCHLRGYTLKGGYDEDQNTGKARLLPSIAQ